MSEAEVQERVDWKMFQILQSIKNKKAIHIKNAYEKLSQKDKYLWDAFQILEEIVEKERKIPVPYDDMLEQLKKRLRNDAVDEIMKLINEAYRQGRVCDVSRIVNIVEKAQSFLK